MKICSFEGCGRQSVAKTLCKVHYNMAYSGKPLKPIGAHKTKEQKLCTFEGCQRKYLAKGYCKKHYNKFWYNKNASKPREPVELKRCNVDNCKRVHYCKGYCSLHYVRWKNTGSTEILPKAKKPVHKKCDVETCPKNRWRQNYCYGHYNEIVLQILPKFRGKYKTKEKNYCYVDDCESIAKALGLCPKHYGRLKRHGNVHANYANNHKRTVKNIVNTPLKYTHSYEEVMILNDFFEESMGLKMEELE